MKVLAVDDHALIREAMHGVIVELQPESPFRYRQYVLRLLHTRRTVGTGWPSRSSKERTEPY